MTCSHKDAVHLQTMYIGKEVYCSECENRIRCVDFGEYEVIE